MVSCFQRGQSNLQTFKIILESHVAPMQRQAERQPEGDQVIIIVAGKASASLCSPDK